MTCNCIDDINSKMPNQKLGVVYSFGSDEVPIRVYIPLYRKDKIGTLETRKGQPKYMVGDFCPFCGTRYIEKVETPESVGVA